MASTWTIKCFSSSLFSFVVVVLFWGGGAGERRVIGGAMHKSKAAIHYQPMQHL